MNGNYPLAAHMINQFNRVDMISNNLANANTNGFKQEHMTEGTFNNYITKKHENQSPLIRELNTINNSVPKLNGKYKNEEMGAIELTGNSLDYALKHSDTFFKVQNPNGEVVLTRNGAFKIVDNLLVTGDNRPVLTADNAPIEVELGGDFEDLIGIVRADYENLEKIGHNNYRVVDQNQIEFLEEDNLQYMLNGALEKSNVNPVSEMVALIEAHRRLENAQKAMYSLGDMSTKLLEKLGTKQ